jgi:hypothetical protein
MNNADVLKSLGYLKKSLRMTSKSIKNAVYSNDPDVAELKDVSILIVNLINEIDAIEMGNVAPIIPAPTSQAIAPMVQVVAQKASMDNGTGTGNGVDFLDPV